MPGAEGSVSHQRPILLAALALPPTLLSSPVQGSREPSAVPEGDWRAGLQSLEKWAHHCRPNGGRKRHYLGLFRSQDEAGLREAYMGLRCRAAWLEAEGARELDRGRALGLLQAEGDATDRSVSASPRCFGCLAHHRPPLGSLQGCGLAEATRGPA